MWLHAKAKVVGHYNGRDYAFEQGEYRPVDDDAARHMIKNLDLEIVDGPPAPEPPEPQKVVCPICDKDFSGAEDPEYSLSQHVKAAHRPKKEAEKDGN